MELDEDKYCSKGDLLYAWACNFGPHFWKEEKVIFHYHIWKLIEDKSKLVKITNFDGYLDEVGLIIDDYDGFISLEAKGDL